MDYNFTDVIKQFDRLCKLYGERNCDPKVCPVSALIDLWEHANCDSWDGGCLNFATIWPDRFEEEVMKWAEVHEEPVYPTTRDIINNIRALMQVDESRVEYEEFLDMPLNRAAAEYFGFVPINENKLV